MNVNQKIIFAFLKCLKEIIMKYIIQIITLTKIDLELEKKAVKTNVENIEPQIKKVRNVIFFENKNIIGRKTINTTCNPMSVLDTKGPVKSNIT